MSDVANPEPDIIFHYDGIKYGVVKDGNIWRYISHLKEPPAWRPTDWHNFKTSGDKPARNIVPQFFALALISWNRLQSQKKHPCEVF